jgi:hypothetical protein
VSLHHQNKPHNNHNVFQQQGPNFHPPVLRGLCHRRCAKRARFAHWQHRRQGTPYPISNLSLLLTDVRSKARTRRTSQPPRKTSPMRPPKLAPSPSHPPVVSQKTTQIAQTDHGTRTSVPQRKLSAVLLAPRASSRTADVRTRRARNKRLLDS